MQKGGAFNYPVSATASGGQPLLQHPANYQLCRRASHQCHRAQLPVVAAQPPATPAYPGADYYTDAQGRVVSIPMFTPPGSPAQAVAALPTGSLAQSLKAAGSFLAWPTEVAKTLQAQRERGLAGTPQTSPVTAAIQPPAAPPATAPPAIKPATAQQPQVYINPKTGEKIVWRNGQ